MRVLHIVATPRATQSNTLAVSTAVLERIQAEVPAAQIDEFNLFARDLPSVAGENIDAKYALMAGQPIDPEHAESWERIERLIENFLAADVYVITAPMWNFSIPYALKYYIDCLVQPGYLFRYDHTGTPVPMVHGKRMVCVTSRGSDYSEGGPMHAHDFQEPYLRAIFGFVGITDIQFINAQPMNVTPDLRSMALSSALTSVQTLRPFAETEQVGAPG